ncbi:hypothetical protein SNOG_15846 [Parastagonospora nodorum SN15]|uniref:Uncharacterized protein n=1 Tax=Phaeosphaeria nodorum (strain SN15 / ATCC MYA-4574 / FGSC 10173) TaxID=321614 RepID=Q0TX35_PHANO|nr:hypothetical protein SNOG_15846 [Parastagonospora nodorum SN15]EAT76684.1 hypothetical protein SNOG_15846 [Parastagonospora nodorum SN15]
MEMPSNAERMTQWSKCANSLFVIFVPLTDLLSTQQGIHPSMSSQVPNAQSGSG